MCMMGNINMNYSESKLDDLNTAEAKITDLEETNEHSQQMINVSLYDMSTNHSCCANNGEVSMKKPILSKLVLKKRSNNTNIYVGNKYKCVC